MATQTFMPEMQSLPPGTVQAQQGNGNGSIANGNTVTVAVIAQPSQSQQPPGQSPQVTRLLVV